MWVCSLAAWQEVEQKLGDGKGDDSTGLDGQRPVQYSEKTPSAAMKSKCLRLHFYTDYDSPAAFAKEHNNRVNRPRSSVVAVLRHLDR